MTQRRSSLKSETELQREIDFIQWERTRTKSPDRQHRAQTAIRTREKQLQVARQAQPRRR